LSAPEIEKTPMIRLAAFLLLLHACFPQGASSGAVARSGQIRRVPAPVFVVRTVSDLSRPDLTDSLFPDPIARLTASAIVVEGFKSLTAKLLAQGPVVIIPRAGEAAVVPQSPKGNAKAAIIPLNKTAESKVMRITDELAAKLARELKDGRPQAALQMLSSYFDSAVSMPPGEPLVPPNGSNASSPSPRGLKKAKPGKMKRDKASKDRPERRKERSRQTPPDRKIDLAGMSQKQAVALLKSYFPNVDFKALRDEAAEIMDNLDGEVVKPVYFGALRPKHKRPGVFELVFYGQWKNEDAEFSFDATFEGNDSGFDLVDSNSD